MDLHFLYLLATVDIISSNICEAVGSVILAAALIGTGTTGCSLSDGIIDILEGGGARTL